MNSAFELDKAALAKYCQVWLRASNNTQRVDRAHLNDAVKTFYTSFDKEPPAVVLCQSPWQMITMTAALQRGIDEETAEHIKQPEHNSFAAPEWKWLWTSLWKTIEAEVSPELSAQLLRKQGNSGWDIIMSGSAAHVGQWRRLQNSPLNLRDRLLLEHLEKIEARRFQRSTRDHVFERFYKQVPSGWPSLNMIDQVRHALVADTIGTQRFELAGMFTALAGTLPQLFSYTRDIGEKLFPSNITPGAHVLLELNLHSLSVLESLTMTRSLMDGLVFYQFLFDASGSPLPHDIDVQMKALLELARCTPFTLQTEHACFVCEPPQIFATDQLDRLHAETGPALAFSDGFKMFSIEGVTVPRQVVEAPDTLTSEQILRQQNTEIRRLMITRYGAGRFLKDIGAQRIQEDECGILYRKNIPREEPIVMVKVLNSTPEPDGTTRAYFMRVPPTIKTAREAVAWTFNIPGDEYHPETET